MTSNDTEQTDRIYSEYRERIADFVFDERVVSVFDDMIRRSVPGYATVIAMTRVFAEHYAQPESVMYDLGCSLGAGTLAMRQGITQPGCKIVSVDNSPAMIERCHEIVQSDINLIPVEVLLADIREIDIQNASVVALNFVLQFLPPDHRNAMIQKIFDGLRPGGVLILSEKVAFASEDENDFQIDMHHHFKHLMGYSRLEISQKRKALEKVMIPDTIPTHIHRLKQAGFDPCQLWFQCFNFISLAAFKHV